MVSVLARFWNEIAATQQLRTAWAKRMFVLDQDQINEEIDVEYYHLKAAGIPEQVASDYLKVKALLLENIAISHWIMDTGRDDLRMALPDICSVEEAVMVAGMNRNNTETDIQRKQLADLLKASLPGRRTIDFISCVSRKDFDSALKTIKTGNKGKKPFDLDMTFKKTSLRLESNAASMEIPLTAIVGSPRITLAFDGQTMLDLAGTFTGSNLHFSLTDGKFKMERLALPWRVTR